MAHCQNCGCSKISCGCKDTYLTTPPPCPTPVDCPDPQPCSEVFDAQCIVYTGANILCGQDTVVTQNDSVAESLANIIDYFCKAVTGSTVIPADIFCQESPQVNTLVVPEDTVVDAAIALVVEYFCDRFSKLDQWLTIQADTGSTTANTPTDTLTIAGGDDISTSITGDTLTINYTGNPGVAPWQYVNASSLGTYTTTLTTNSRVIYEITAPGGAVFKLPYNGITVGDEIEILFIGSCNVTIAPVSPVGPSLEVTVSVWQPAGLITATKSLSEVLRWNAVTATTEGLRIKLVFAKSDISGYYWYVVDQTWNDQAVVVV